MIEQATYKRAKRQLAIAQGRFTRARAAMSPNPFANKATRKARADAINAARKLRDVANDGLATFEEQGYPDAWHNWERSAYDARLFLQRWDDSAERGW